MKDFDWKGLLAVGIGTVLIAWTTRDLFAGASELVVLLGIALVAAGAASLAVRQDPGRREMLRRLDALEASDEPAQSEPAGPPV